jgi:hypothetical protein
VVQEAVIYEMSLLPSLPTAAATLPVAQATAASPTPHPPSLRSPAAVEEAAIYEQQVGQQVNDPEKRQTTIDGKKVSPRLVADIDPHEFPLWVMDKNNSAMYRDAHGQAFLCNACDPTKKEKHHDPFCVKCINFALNKEEIHEHRRLERAKKVSNTREKGQLFGGVFIARDVGKRG